MNLLFKVFGIIKIEFSTILAFVLGIFFGMMLLGLIYALVVVISLGNKKYIIKTENDTLTEAKAKDMIHEAQESFKDKVKRGDNTKMEHFKALSYDLVLGISQSFYPNSKYPLAELSIDECISLFGYIQIRLSELLDKRGLRILKRVTVSTIINMVFTSLDVKDSKAFKATKEVSKYFKVFKKVVNAINPVTWFRVTVCNLSIKLAVDKLYVVTLGIIGEEAFKIYSKSLLNQKVDIDSGVDELADEMDSELKEIEAHIKDEMNKEINNNQAANDNDIRFKSKSIKISDKKLIYDSIFDKEKEFVKKENGNV